MDVHVDQVQASVRVVDDRSLLSPDVLDAIVRAVVERLQGERDSAARAGDDRRLWPSVRVERER